MYVPATLTCDHVPLSHLVVWAVSRQAVRRVGTQAHWPNSKQGVGACSSRGSDALSCQREMVLKGGVSRVDSL
jgi:hypothetical protein